MQYEMVDFAVVVVVDDVVAVAAVVVGDVAVAVVANDGDLEESLDCSQSRSGPEMIVFHSLTICYLHCYYFRFFQLNYY